MEIVVDIGNSNVVFGFYDDSKWVHQMRFKTKKDGNANIFYDLKIRENLLDSNLVIDNITGIYLSSVVPDLTNELSAVVSNTFDHDVVIINPAEFKQLKLSIDNPSEIGNDLVANAVSAVSRYNKGCIVVDFGTALTFTVVTEAFEILGVAIAPGLKTSISALHIKTAQLPEVPLELPKTVIGKNTTHAIQSGVLWGYIGLVKEMIIKISEEYEMDLLPVATGGLSSVLLPLKELFFEIDDSLTLDGIRIMGRGIKRG